MNFLNLLKSTMFSLILIFCFSSMLNAQEEPEIVVSEKETVVDTSADGTKDVIESAKTSESIDTPETVEATETEIKKAQDVVSEASTDVNPKVQSEEIDESSFDDFDDFDDMELSEEDAELLGEAGLEEDDKGAKDEHLLVGYVAAGVSVAALAAGVGLGVYALTQYNCLIDVAKCNESRTDKIVEGKYFDEKAFVEHLSISADAMYLFAGAAALASSFSLVQAYFFDEPAKSEEEVNDAQSEKGQLELKKTDEKVSE